MKKLLSVLSMIAFFAGCQGVDNATSPSASNETVKPSDVIKIGYIGSLTGGAASIGQDEKKAIELFLEKNPIISDKKVEIVWEDTQCKGQLAASAAQKLVEVDKVAVILGGLCSSETLAAASIAEKNKVILFSSTSTSPEITNAGDYIFRNAPSDSTSSDVMSDTLASKFKKIAIISETNEFAADYREALIPKLQKKGVQVVVDDKFNPDTTDFKTILQKVADSEAEVLVNLAGEVPPAGFINKQAKELGIKLPIYGTDVMTGSEFFDIAKDSAEGTIIVITAADKSREDVTAFFEEFKKKFGEYPSAEVYAVLNFDKMNILKNAIEKVGYDSTKLKDYLYQMSTYRGLAGETKFDKNGDSSILPSLMIAKNGKLELYKE